MAASGDLVRPLKIETPDETGYEDDMGYQTETNPSDDTLLAKGLAIEDENTFIEKDINGNMIFQDNNTGPHTLLDLLSDENLHIDGGDADDVYTLDQIIDGGGA